MAAGEVARATLLLFSRKDVVRSASSWLANAFVVTSIVPLVTAFAVLLHALLGCCMHHDHFAGGGRSNAHLGVAQACCSHGAADCENLQQTAFDPLQASGSGTLVARATGQASDDEAAPEDHHREDHRPANSCDGEPCMVVLRPLVSLVLNLDLHWIDCDRAARQDAAPRVAAAPGSPVAAMRPASGRLQSQLCIWLI